MSDRKVLINSPLMAQSTLVDNSYKVGAEAALHFNTRHRGLGVGVGQVGEGGVIICLPHNILKLPNIFLESTISQ